MPKKLFVTSNLMAAFICPKCGKSKQKDVSKFIEHETQVKLKYKCNCQHSFSVILERRRSIRKKLQLKGHIIRNSKKHVIKIEDLSRHGVKINILKNISLKKGEEIEIEFILDDPNRSKVSRRVHVRKINSPTDIGCEFISCDHYGSLGKYFLFYF